MEDLRTIANRDNLTSAKQRSGSATLLQRHSGLLSASMAESLQVLWLETIHRYPNQEMQPLTADLYLTEWTEMMQRFGENLFAASLLKVIRRPGRTPFLPTPDEIREELESAAREAANERSTRRHLAQLDEAKALYERERAEDIANGLTPIGTGERAVMTEATAAARARIQARAASAPPPPPPLPPAPSRIVDLTEGKRRNEVIVQRMCETDPDFAEKVRQLRELAGGAG